MATHDRNAPLRLVPRGEVATRSDAEQRADRAEAARDKVAELEPKLPKQLPPMAAPPTPVVPPPPEVAVHRVKAARSG